MHSLTNSNAVPFGKNPNIILFDSKRNADRLKYKPFNSNENQRSNSCLKQLHWYVVLTEIFLKSNKQASNKASRKAFKQASNQASNQESNQPSNQEINKSNKQAIKKSSNQSAKQASNKEIKQSSNQ